MKNCEECNKVLRGKFFRVSEVREPTEEEYDRGNWFPVDVDENYFCSAECFKIYYKEERYLKGEKMSEPNYMPMMDVKCPFCNSIGQQLEDVGDHQSYLSGTCDTCNRNFSVDIMREEYYNEKGDIIK